MSTYVTAVDFGSGKIAVAVGEKRDGRVHVVHYESAQATGIRYGEIFNDYQVSRILNPMIRRAEQVIGETISSAVVSISGKFIRTTDAEARDKQKDPNRRISMEDVKRMIAEQYTRAAGGDSILEVAPQSYNVDDQIGLSGSDLEGIRSSVLDGYFKLIIGKKQQLDKRRSVLSECSLSIRKAIFSPVASARAVLTAQEMDNGVALVDIGKDLTEVVIVKENVIRDAFVIPFAGESITNDIKNLTNFTATWAETTKLANGSCLEEKVPDGKMLELVGEEGNVEGSVDLLLLTRIIEARMSEILDAVKYLIDNSEYGTRIPAGVVITGGTAYLNHLPLLAGAILGRKVRLAAPRSAIADDSVEAALDTVSSTVVGLLLEFYEPRLSTTLNAAQRPEAPLSGGFRFSEPDRKKADKVERVERVEKAEKFAAEPVAAEPAAAKPAPEPKKEKPRKEKGNGLAGFNKFMGTLFGDSDAGDNV